MADIVAFAGCRCRRDDRVWHTRPELCHGLVVEYVLRGLVETGRFPSLDVAHAFLEGYEAARPESRGSLCELARFVDVVRLLADVKAEARADLQRSRT
jgi:hypothetical protein